MFANIKALLGWCLYIRFNSACLISKSALSPVTMTKTDYDPWTKKLTVYFRFDDSYGRKYDIVDVKYCVKDEMSNGIRINEW